MRIYQEDVATSRVQLVLDVADPGKAIVFYSKLFATEPADRLATVFYVQEVVS